MSGSAAAGKKGKDHSEGQVRATQPGLGVARAEGDKEVRMCLLSTARKLREEGRLPASRAADGEGDLARSREGRLEVRVKLSQLAVTANERVVGHCHSHRSDQCG